MLKRQVTSDQPKSQLSMNAAVFTAVLITFAVAFMVAFIIDRIVALL